MTASTMEVTGGRLNSRRLHIFNFALQIPMAIGMALIERMIVHHVAMKYG